MSAFETLIAEVQDLKKKAKNRRDLDRYDSATGHIQDAIAKLNTFAPAAPLSDDEANEITVQLADCYGILGGIYRRDGLQEKDSVQKQGKFRASYEYYEQGYELEKKSNQPNSYNRLNRLISQVLAEPALLKSNGQQTVEQIALSDKLKTAASAIEVQLRTDRRRDVWALADLALIRILLNENDPSSAFADFLSEAPPSFVCNSLLSTLVPLSELDIDPKQKLQKAVELIQSMTV